MTQAETACPDAWGSHFLEYRGRLLALARRNLNPVLARRVSAEDVVQEALLAACGKMAFLKTIRRFLSISNCGRFCSRPLRLWRGNICNASRETPAGK